jgi:hypothetical protein
VDLASLLGGSVSLAHKQYRLACRIERSEYSRENFRPNGSNDGQIEGVGLEIAADVSAHQGKRRRVPLSLPTIDYGA